MKDVYLFFTILSGLLLINLWVKTIAFAILHQHLLKDTDKEYGVARFILICVFIISLINYLD